MRRTGNICLTIATSFRFTASTQPRVDLRAGPTAVSRVQAVGECAARGCGTHRTITAAAETAYWKPVSAAGYGKCSTANLLMMLSRLCGQRSSADEKGAEDSNERAGNVCRCWSLATCGLEDSPGGDAVSQRHEPGIGVIAA